jgi:site-specific recombinase XerD
MAIEPSNRTAIISAGASERAKYDQRLLELVRETLSSDLAQASIRAYASDWGRFKSFAEEHGVPAIPATEELLCLYLADMKVNGLKRSSITRSFASIKYFHNEARKPLGPLPMVSDFLSGLSRSMRSEPTRVKPLLPEHLQQIAEGIRGDHLRDVRDLAMLLVGFCAALRRSEIVALNREDIEFVTEGMRVTLVRRKNAQRSSSMVAVPKQEGLCPVVWLRRWLEMSKIEDGPLFRPISGPTANVIIDRHMEPEVVAEIVKYRAKLIGLDPSKYSGHSLRSGLATSAARAGVPVHRIMETTGHKSMQVALGYIREANAFGNAASGQLLKASGEERINLREKARRLHQKRGASPEVIRQAFLKGAGVDVPAKTIAEWLR